MYLNGGIFSWVSNPRGRFRVSGVHGHGRKYFWRFLKLVAYFLMIHLLLGLVIYLPYLLTTGSQTGLTDEQIVRPLIICMSVHLILLVFIFLLSDLAKSRLFEQDSRKVVKTIFTCVKLAFRNIFSFYFLGLLLLVVPLALYAGFWLIRSSVTANGSGMILIVFVLQQFFIFLRVFARAWRLAAVYHYQLRVSV